ncbi:DNA-formamidopyrimidine glycosylase family protein [Halobacteriovorax sp. XZX-3]|uniref:Fpg/Nei family DNA glycosylase n=1 Tax=unclassified Halobacteriovorax TaxID=2639665 RepID=UPI00371F1894
MPELPEVETIKSQLSHVLPMEIEDVEYSDVSDSIVKDKDFNPKGMTLERVERQGKVLRFFFTDQDGNEWRAISGLGMSGSWRIATQPITEKHTHIKLIGTNAKGPLHLGYIDPRRFGVFHLYSPPNEATWLTRLGPDVSKAEFTLEYLLMLKKERPNKVLKPFLLEQNFFSGVGNYMASEICARAGVRPTRRMKTLTKLELEKVFMAVKIVLDDSISTGGTTFSGGYQDAFGEKGEGVKNLVVFYQKICGLCKETEVKKITLAQRGTYYCPHCQK